MHRVLTRYVTLDTSCHYSHSAHRHHFPSVPSPLWFRYHMFRLVGSGSRKKNIHLLSVLRNLNNVVSFHKLMHVLKRRRAYLHISSRILQQIPAVAVDYMPFTVLYLWVTVVLAGRKFVVSSSSRWGEFLQTGHHLLFLNPLTFSNLIFFANRILPSSYLFWAGNRLVDYL
jgi:hypothetical protein